MASIRKLPSGHYRVRWKDLAGREYGETFPNKKAALAKKAAVETKTLAGSYPDPSLGKQTLGSYLSEILAGDNLRPSTRALYEIQARRYIVPRLGARTLVSIRPPDVRRLYQDLLEDGVGKPTIEVVHRLLSKVLSQAFRDGLIPVNPASQARAPRGGRKQVRVPSEIDVERIADAIDYRYRAMVLVAAWGGLRFGEVAALRVKHLHFGISEEGFTEGRIEVVEAVSEVGGRLFIGPPKSSASIRTVAIPGSVVEELQKHLADNPADPDQLLFPAPHGGVMGRSRFRSRFWLPALKLARLEHLDFHDLRHFAAAIAIKHGAHPKAIQERLGHQSIRTTLDIYGHLFPSLGEELAVRLNKARHSALEKILARGTPVARNRQKRKAPVEIPKEKVV